MTVDGRALAQPLVVRRNPRVHVSEADPLSCRDVAEH